MGFWQLLVECPSIPTSFFAIPSMGKTNLKLIPRLASFLFLIFFFFIFNFHIDTYARRYAKSNQNIQQSLKAGEYMLHK